MPFTICITRLVPEHWGGKQYFFCSLAAEELLEHMLGVSVHGVEASIGRYLCCPYVFSGYVVCLFKSKISRVLLPSTPQ